MANTNDILKHLKNHAGSGVKNTTAPNTSSRNATSKTSSNQSVSDQILSHIDSFSKKNPSDSYVKKSYGFDSRINDLRKWSDDLNSLYKGAQDYYKSWRPSDTFETYDTFYSGRADELRAQAEEYRAHFRDNADIVKYIDDALKGLDESFGINSSNKDYWANWETESDYNAYLDQQKKEKEQSVFDLEAGQKEIDDLEAERQKILDEKKSRNAGANGRPYAVGQQDAPDFDSFTTGYGITNNRPYAAGLQVQKQETPEDTRLREIDQLISKKKQYLNQAKRIQESEAYANTVKNVDFDRFDDYVKSDDALYNWINDEQFRDSYESNYVNPQQGSVGGSQNHNAQIPAPLKSEFARKGYDRMNANEIAIYNYYYAKSGKEAAQKYLDNIQETLNRRVAEDMYGGIKDSTAAKIVFGAAVGLNQFGSNVENFFNTEDDYIAQTAYQLAGGMVREDLADEGKKIGLLGGVSLGQIAYDTVSTTANMAPSILASYAVGAAAGTLGLSAKTAQAVGSYTGSAMMGISAAGGAYQQALNEGFDKDQARGYSILVGASEMAMEKLLGGISAVGGNALGINMTKNIANADTALKAIAKRLGGSMISEFGEEYLQEVLEPVFSNIMLKTDKEVKPISTEALYSGILGLLSAGFMEGPTTISNEVKTANTGRNIKEAGGVDSLAKIGNTFAADTVAYKLAGKVNENTGAYTIGQLLKEVDATLTEQNVSEIAEALMKEGMGENEAKQYAEVFAYVVEGGAMPDSLVNAIEADTLLAKAARKVLFEDNTTWNQRTQGYNEVLRKLAEDKVKRDTAPSNKTNAPADNTVDAQMEGGSDGNVEPAKYGSIQTIKNGKVTVKMTDGTEVDLKDADLDPEDSVRIETITSIDGISAEDASGIFNILKAGSKNSRYDAIGAREAYRYGYYGLTEKHMNESGTFSKTLTPEQRKAIYDIGKKARDTSVDAKVDKFKQMRNASTQKEPAKLHITYNQGNGVVQDIESKTITGLSRKQRAAASFAKVLHKLGVGTDFEFFESYLSKTLEDKNGNRARVFLDDSGNEVIAYSGVYQTADGKIRIDLNAYSGRGLALNAMSHELVHFIKEWSPDRYRTMADIVGNAYGNTQMSMHQRVLREQARLNRIRGTEVSYDEAYDEVVANALNRMLDDGTVLDRIAEIRKVDGGLADQMIECIRKFIKRFAKVFADNESLFYDTEDLMQFKDTVEELRGMFAEALVEASDNRLSSVETEAVESLGENATVETNEDGQLLLAKNESGNVLMYSEQTYQMGGRDKLKSALKQNGHTAEEINETLSFVDDALDYIKILAAGYAKNMGYTKLSNHLVADIVTNVKTGKQVMSSIVNNGDYPVNIDLSLICKKRVAYMNLMSRLIRDGIFDKVNYDGAAIAEVNGILRENGFETACLGCFVESRRLQFQAWAETIVSEWNSEVEKRNPNAKHFGFAKGKMEALTDADINALTAELESVKKNDQGNVNLGQGNSVTRMGRLLDALPSLQMKLTVEDLLTPEGLTALRKHDGSLFSIVKSRYGAASPKIVQDFNPYASEIAMLTFAQVKGITNNAVKGAQAYVTEVKREYGRPKKANGESREDFNQRKKDHEQRVQDEAMRRYLYDIGGARIQSFSDFMIENVFDYIQIFADLSAKRLPLHGYSKEIVCLRLFGMTGAKWNGSLIAHVERSMGKEFAGLLPAGTKDGIPVNVDGKEYVIGFDDYARNVSTSGKSFIQSIGMKDIIALQLDPRYSPYIGNITIGVSDAQIMAMLDNPLFRMVIPYHASGMLPMFAKLVGVDMYNDYTDYQNTTIRQYYDVDGNAVSELKNAKGEAVKADTSFAFNAETQKTKDAKTAADNYLRWCAQRHPVYDGKTLVGYATFNPKFSSSPYGNDFTRHENYYKLLEDFNTYDSLTEESAVQGAVTMNFPSEENRLTRSQMEAYKKSLRETGIFSEKDIEKYAKKADMTFKEIINAEVGNRANYESTQAPKWESTVKAVEEKLQKDYGRQLFSSQETDRVKTFKNGQNDMGEFVANVLIDLADPKSDFWTGRYNYAILGISKTDETEFKQFHQKIEELTQDLDEYEDYKGPVIEKTFTIQDGKGKEFIYRVSLDGYMHGVVLRKIDKAKYQDYVKKYKGGTNNGRTPANTIRRISGARSNLGRNGLSGSRNNASGSNTGHGGVAGNAQGMLQTGNVRKGQSANQTVRSVDAPHETDADGNTLSEQQKTYFSKSVVRDQNGQLLVMYHGTADGGLFTVFEGDKLGNSARSSQIGQGFYFTNVKKEAEAYMKNVDIYGRVSKGKNPYLHQVYLNITNPFNVNTDTLDINNVKSVFMDGTYDYFFDSYIPFYLNRKSVNGDVLTRSVLENMRKEEKVSLYVDYYAQIGTRDLLREMVRAFPSGRQGELLAAMKKHLGYDGIVDEFAPGQFQYVAFSSEQIKNVDNKTPTSNVDIRYSTQETDNITARDLLSSTDVATIKNEVVKKKLSDYQKILEVKNAEDQKLREIRAEIKELSFAKAPKDTKKLKDLKFEAIKINNHISVYEGQLQRMEKELQSVVKRERAKVVKEAEKRDKAVLAKEWMDAQVKQNELLREYREIEAAAKQQESDASIMEKEFIRIVKEYEKLDAKRGKTISGLRQKLREAAESHRADQKMWMTEFGRLMREYDAAERNIDRLEQKIIRQRASAKERVQNRNKTAMRHKIQNVVKELNSLLLTNDKKRHVPDNLKKPVEEALKLLNMDTVDAENRAAKYADLIAKEQAKANPDQDKIDSYTMTMENILRQGEKMGQRIKELHEAYEEIQNSDDPDIANAYDPVIAGAIQELSATIGNTSIKNMTMEQLSDVYDVYRAVLTRVRDANKAMAENIRASIEELAKSTIREVQTVGGAKKYRVSNLDAVRKFDWNNMKPVYAMERIGSSTLTEVFNNVRAGEDTWAKDVSEAREYYLEKSKKYGYDKWDFDKKYRFESNSGIPFELTLEQILSLYAYSKRDQAADHLRLGGFVFDSNSETYMEKDGKKSLLKYKVNTADAHQITPEIMADIIGKLSKEQAGFVDEMQDYLSTVMGAKGNEVTSKMYGVKLFKEKFYFPLKSAKQFMFEQNEVSGEVRIKNSGFTNKVVAKANNPVVLSNFMDVWSGHVNDMSMYHAFTLPLEDFNRVFNYNTPKKDGVEPVSVKGTIQNAYGPAAVSYVKQLITDLNGGARTDSTTGVINKLTGMFKKGAVFASLSVVVQQPSAIARAAALVDIKYFIGPKVDQKRHKYLWAEVKKYAPVAIIKEMGYFDTNMGKSTQDFITGKEYSGIKEKEKAVVTDSSYRDELLSKAPALADEYAWCGIWAAVKRETKAKHPSMDTTSEAFLKLAGKRFTEVITKTQVYDSVLARSANMRSKDTGMKMATAFMAEPTTSINMIEDAIWKAKRGDKKYVGKAIGAVVASQILNAILVSFVYAGRDDDEDETYAEKYIGALTGSLADGLNAATYIPFIKDIVSIMQGYDVERSDMAVVSDLWNAWKNLKNDKVSPYRKVENFAGSIAQIFGLPVKNIMRDVRGIYNTITNLAGAEQTTGAGVKYAISGAITGKTVSDKEQLYKARLEGDQQHAARVAARYDDEDSADAAVRAAIKDSFMADEIDEATAVKHMVLYAGMDGSEAHWTMDAWKYRKKVGSDDGYGKYGKFHDAVRSGKNLESVIKEYTDNGVKTSTLTGEITDEFKPVYLEASNSEKAAMKTKLISAYVACDMEREDAEKKLESWDFEAEYGFVYSDRKEAYLSGKVSKATLVDILIDRGYDEEDAEAQVEAYEWEGAGFEDVTTSAIRNYNEWCEPVGIPKSVYLEFWRFDNSTENKVDKTTGKKIAYSAVKEIMAYINSLNLTDRQKDALAKSAGWADKTITKYKLW